ncbi:MAG: hypothetical protein GC162_20430 [Planctomycetes bacterium]|nr:hypothetical protein [Planctomycetota bacterium]
MVTIGKMFRKSKRFFRAVAGCFTYGGYGHFWQFVLALTTSHAGTLKRLIELLRGPAATYRTNHGDFLWRSGWDEAWVFREMPWIRCVGSTDWACVTSASTSSSTTRRHSSGRRRCRPWAPMFNNTEVEAARYVVRLQNRVESRE